MNKKRRAMTTALLALAYAVGADTFEYGADTFRATFAEGKERTELAGNAWVISESLRIEADDIELYGPDFRYVICGGAVRAEDGEKGIVLVSTHLFFDRELDLIRIQGPVEMIDLQNEVVVRGAYLESRDGNSQTIIQIGVRIVRRDMISRSEYARYDRDADILYLTGLPEVNRDGDIFRADEIIINLETDEITLHGEVRGSLTVPEDEEDAAED